MSRLGTALLLLLLIASGAAAPATAQNESAEPVPELDRAELQMIGTLVAVLLLTITFVYVARR